MSRPPHPPRLYNSNYTWRRVQIMKLLVMQFSPPSRHSIPRTDTMKFKRYTSPGILHSPIVPTATTRLRARMRSCGIRGGHIGIRECLLGVRRGSLQDSQPTDCSALIVIRGRYKRPLTGPSSIPPQRNNEKKNEPGGINSHSPYAVTLSLYLLRGP
jgi:hypothetical protein